MFNNKRISKLEEQVNGTSEFNWRRYDNKYVKEWTVKPLDMRIRENAARIDRVENDLINQTTKLMTKIEERLVCQIVELNAQNKKLQVLLNEVIDYVYSNKGTKL